MAIAETGTVAVVESEGNGRMCLTLPRVLITVMGIEKVLPTFADLEVFLQLLPRSSTGERMNPYTSMWTGVTPGDGPQEFHLVLLDNGRTKALADELGRQALHCIRCSACLNVCPVYEHAGGHAYGSVYPGPIGAILTPQLLGLGEPGGPAGPHDPTGSLPFASTLCGACYEACPVRIDIPSALLHLRERAVTAQRGVPSATDLAMGAAARMLSSGRLLRVAGGLVAALGQLSGARRVRPPALARVAVDRGARPAPPADPVARGLVARSEAVVSAREEVLGRIRSALAGAAAPGLCRVSTTGPVLTFGDPSQRWSCWPGA